MKSPAKKSTVAVDKPNTVASLIDAQIQLVYALIAVVHPNDATLATAWPMRAVVEAALLTHANALTNIEGILERGGKAARS